MSMPHDTTAASEPKEKWLHDHRKDVFPNKADWTVQAVNGTHIWLETEVSGCFSQDCKKSGPRKKCAACKIVAHEKCIQQQIETIPKCRMTFRDATGPCKGTIDVNPPHHIVYRRKQDGRCDVCGKGFQSMLSYKTQKENIALNCTWCKRGFHTKDCSKQFLKEKHCDLGLHKNVILPPSWIVKLPPRKYSTVSPKRGKASTRRHSSRERRAFVVKAVESDHNKIPLIIFVNPRSGGNQGFRILEKYQYLLNPRQVFDLSCGGPRFGLDLYRKVPNLRILVCGGDGSVGWVLSEIDRLKMNPVPSVSILPLGTGNDLARFLGWGGGYADEPLSKIITHVEEGEVQKLDRWDLDVRPNTNPTVENEPNEENSSPRLPLNVMNNYFSMGADAEVVLEFHESREANPEKFNSRLKNKYFYSKMGGEAIVKRKNKDLHKCIESFVCDGCDLTEKIRELKPISIIFLNIPSFASGTSPWGNPSGDVFLPQSCDDGYLEIVGLTSKSLVATQVGGHGIRIYQCQSALLYTNTKIAMQVDGEPCRLNASRIHIKKRNQANMIVKKKPHDILYHPISTIENETTLPSTLCTKLYYLNFSQYDSLVKYDITEIKSVVTEIGSIQVEPEIQLDEMRKRLETMKATGQLFSSRLTNEWCFLDASWTARIYRIDEAQEPLLHVGDIIEGGIYVLDLNKEAELSVPMNINLSKSQPNSPQLDRRLHSNLPTVEEHINRTPPRAIHSLSLDFSQLPTVNRDDDGIDSDIDYESDLSEFSENEEDMNSLSSSPGMTSPPNTPISPACNDLEFEIPEDDGEKEKALFDAAKRGQLSKFQEIHSAGTSLSARDGFDRTALHIAAKYGRKDIVNYIVDKVTALVINLADRENGHTPLHVAAQYKRRTICRTLINHGASVTRFDLDGNSPRLLALQAEDADLAKYLQSQERLQLIAADDHETAV